MIVVDGIGQIAQGFFVVLFIVFIVDRLGGGGVEVGLVRGSMAVGAIVGAVVIAKLGKQIGPITLLTAGYVGMGAVSFLFWNAPIVTTGLWLYMIIFAVSGAPGSSMGVGLTTALQQFSPSGMLGRVAGTAGAVDALARAIGSLTAGFLVGRVRLIGLLDAEAGIYLLCGALALVSMRDGRATDRR